MRADKYFPNMEMTVQGYKLSIMMSGKVYHNSSEGFRKLDSLWQRKIGILSVILSNGNTVKLKASKNGLSIVEDKKNT